MKRWELWQHTATVYGRDMPFLFFDSAKIHNDRLVVWYCQKNKITWHQFDDGARDTINVSMYNLLINTAHQASVSVSTRATVQCTPHFMVYTMPIDYSRQRNILLMRNFRKFQGSTHTHVTICFFFLVHSSLMVWFEKKWKVWSIRSEVQGMFDWMQCD